MSNTRARHRSKAPWPKLRVHYVHNFPCSSLPSLFIESNIALGMYHTFCAPKIALCSHLLKLHYLFSTLCTALVLSLNIKHTTALSALPALLVAVSLIFTPTRLLRRPRATKPLLGEDDGDDGNFLLYFHTFIYMNATQLCPEGNKTTPW